MPDPDNCDRWFPGNEATCALRRRRLSDILAMDENFDDNCIKVIRRYQGEVRSTANGPTSFTGWAVWFDGNPSRPKLADGT